MITHDVRVHPSKDDLQREDQLAWKIAGVAADKVAVDKDVAEMIGNRIIDNAAVAIAAINRRPVVSARDMALARPHKGAPRCSVSPPPNASRRNGPHGRTAPRCANWTCTTRFSPPIIRIPATTSHPFSRSRRPWESPGRDLIRGLATGYEIQIDLVRAISLHEHKIDHIGHLCPAQAAGIGTLLGLKQDVIYQAVQQAVHVSFTTRQSRKGEISSWKAYAPAHSGKLAVEAVDRVLRGEGAPSPIYEGEDSVIAWMLDGPKADYHVPLPAPGERKRAIMDSFTKEHSAEYQSQALIDLAFRMREQISDFEQIEKIMIHTSHHTHYVIGTGANDPQKMDPKASRETLDHSIMYIFAVALEDGKWHHVDSYTSKRAGRADTVRLWHKIETTEDPEWTRRYRSTDPNELSFGGRVEIFMRDGSKLVDEMAVANAHPMGAKPFGRDDYIRKFLTLTDGIVSAREANRFLEAAQASRRVCRRANCIS